MLTRVARALTIGLTFVLLLSVASSADAKRSKKASPGFLKAFNKAHSTLFIGFDPVVHLRSGLQSAAAIKIAELAQRYFEEEIPRQMLLGELNSLAPKLPKEIALGLTDGGISDMGRFVHGLILAFLASEAKDLEDKATLAKVHGELTSLIKAGGLDGFTLYGNLHSEEAAKGLMGMVVGYARKHGPSMPEIVFDIDDDSVKVTLNMAKLLDEGEASELVVSQGIVSGPDDPATSALVGAIRSVVQVVELRRIDAGLRLNFGPPARRSRGLKPKKLGPAYRAEPQDIFWGRSASKPWFKAYKRVQDSLGAYLETPAWRRLEKGFDMALDTLNLEGLAEAIKRREIGSMTSVRVWREEGAIHALEVDEGVKKSTPLSKSSLASILPGSGTLMQADSAFSAELFLSSVFKVVGVVAEELAPRRGEALQTLTAALVSALAGQADALLASGSASLVGWGGDIKSLSLIKTRADGTQRRLEGQHLPHYGVAFALPLKGGVDGLAFGAQLLNTLGEATCTVLGGTVTPGAKLAQPVSLGLGTPTVGIPWDAMSACQIGKSALQLSLSGDLLLHTYQLEDTLILSTSRAMSTRIAATHAGAHTAYTLPSPPKGDRGKLVSFAKLSGNALGAWVGSLAAWVERLTVDGATPKSAEKFSTMLNFGADVMRLVERFEFRSTLKGRVLRSLSQLSFR